MNFERVDERAEEEIRKMLALTSYEGSEFSELYRRGWHFYDYSNMQWAKCGESIFIRFKPKGGFGDCENFVYLPPLTKIENVRAAVEQVVAFVKERGEHACIMALPQEYVDALSGSGLDTENSNPDFEEYLYSPEDLMTLAGKKFHGKRNHVARFCKTYEGRYVFRPYTAADKQGLLDLYAKWSEGKEDEGTLMDEFHLLALGLQMTHEGKTFADVMEIDGEIVGFALGEITASNVAIVHIEKGETRFDGIYAAINKMFAERHYQGVRLVNRQEDMGLEGLRKSKLSYRPVKMVKKYVIRI